MKDATHTVRWQVKLEGERTPGKDAAGSGRNAVYKHNMYIYITSPTKN